MHSQDLIPKTQITIQASELTTDELGSFHLKWSMAGCSASFNLELSDYLYVLSSQNH